MHLWLFFLIVAGVVALPGADMAFVVASALVGGRRNGMAALAGIVAGSACHMTMGALGIAAVLKVMPRAFNAVLLAGAAYLAWIGWSLARHGLTMSGDAAPAARLSTFATFRRGALTNLLNPKAYLFMLAVFPQFVRKEYGPIWLQAVELGAIAAVTQIAGYGTVALIAGRARPSANLARGVGLLLIVVAIATAIEGWRLR
jgi:threonine/homoserine/homoserine lactone efflux protein